MELKRLPTRIAESSLLLPSASAVYLLVWLFAGIREYWWLNLALTAATVYIIVELSNANALIRVRSRMVSSTFLVLSSLCLPLHYSLRNTFVMLCLTLSFFLLFSSYQDKRAVRLHYYASFLIGIASLCHTEILLFMPLFWILALTNIQSLTFRTWIASILGILTPYWLLIPWLFINQEPGLVATHFSKLFPKEQVFDTTMIKVNQWITLSLVMVLGIIAAINFWRFNYEDRIRTRQLYGFFAWTVIYSIFLIFLQPQLFDPLIRIITLSMSTFIAHYFSLSRTRMTQIVFYAGSVAIVIAIIYNLVTWSGLSTF